MTTDEGHWQPTGDQPSFSEVRACRKKSRYQFQNQAFDACRRSGQFHGTELYPYKCRVCGWWHKATKRDAE